MDTLAYKKTHMKEKPSEVVQANIDVFIEKTEKTKDQLVSRILDNIPERRDMSEARTRMVTKVVSPVADAEGAAGGESWRGTWRCRSHRQGQWHRDLRNATFMAGVMSSSRAASAGIRWHRASKRSRMRL